jgi:glycosyltransferase involved in cell wall biosynthesis
VTVIAPVEPGEPEVGNDDGVVVRRAFDFGPGAMRTALAAAEATAAPVVHVQHELFLYGGPAGVPALLTGLAHNRWAGRRRSDSPATVVTMHQVVDPRDVNGEYTRMHRIPVPAPAARLGISAVQRAIRSFADAVVVHEPSFAGIVPGAVTVPHGVEDVAASTDRLASRRALGLDEHRFTALCFGFLAPYKGIETAADAVARTGGVDLVIAGAPHPRLEERHGYARDLRERYGATARFTGYVPDEDVHRWFSAADVVVLPYPAPHASSGALALALAHGTPLLASRPLARTCGLPDTVAFTGSAALADRLHELAADRVQLDRLRDAVAHLRVQRGWSAVADRHVEIYREVQAS